MHDLTIMIPARNEMFLRNTVDDALSNITADTVIIVVLDGQWADPPLLDHPRVTILYHPSSVGQRAATNEAARLADSKYVMKCDAHCAFDKGFDTKMMQPYESKEVERDVTLVPTMYNLHVFDWLCKSCGERTYQGPKPVACPRCKSPEIVMDVVWKPRLNRKSDFMRFDHTLHFQYWGSHGKRPESQVELADQMCCVGACWMMTRERYFEIEPSDENHGSWGQQGVEVACKSWLSGGRQVVNKRTHFAHCFRTQPGFGFPYPNPGIEKARAYSRQLWFGNTWPKQVYPLSWLIDKFKPIPDWHDKTGEQTLREVREAGERFNRKEVMSSGRLHEMPIEPVPMRLPSDVAGAASDEQHAEKEVMQNEKVGPMETRMDGEVSKVTLKRAVGGMSGGDVQVRGDGGQVKCAGGSRTPTKGIVYYTDCRLDPVLMTACQRQLTKSAAGIPVVSVSLSPLDFGRNLVLPFVRGYLTMFRQILAGLHASTSDYIFLAEHDMLYHPSHFEFTPTSDDTYFYNENTYKVDSTSGQALFYYCKQTSGLCASRDLLLAHYVKRVEIVEALGYDRNMGFEPGTHRPPRGVDDHPAERWMSAFPNIDIRHQYNLTPSRWSTDQFRNKNTCLGWRLADEVPGWGVTKGRFAELIRNL